MNKIFGTLLVVLCLNQSTSASADKEEERNNPRWNNYQGQFQSSNGFGGNSFVSSGSGTHSVVQTGGNNIVISRRMGANNELDDYISISHPNIRIDGDYCKWNKENFN